MLPGRLRPNALENDYNSFKFYPLEDEILAE
jgi:hypothetical protein